MNIFDREDILKRLGNFIRKTVKIDNFIEAAKRGNYVRIEVEVDLTKFFLLKFRLYKFI